MEVVASGRRFDDIANSTRIGGYALLNLHGRYELTPELALAARWNNVFDKDYELARGFNTPGSNVVCELRVFAQVTSRWESLCQGGKAFTSAAPHPKLRRAFWRPPEFSECFFA